MKEIPILFSTPMVQATSGNRKKQTRRTKGLEEINADPNKWEFVRLWNGYAKFCEVGNHINELHIKCPYGQVGDVLWVRESVSYFRQADGSIQREKTKYKADEKWNGNKLIKWKPSIHMPKDACRIWLKITNIRVERLQDITEEDAINEGIEKIYSGLFQEWRFKDYANVKDDWRSPISSFQSLWASINGIDAWDHNPWVWVVEFERVAKP